MVEQGNDMPWDGEKRHVLTHTTRALPNDVARLGVDTEKSAQTMMGHAVKLPVVDDSCAHIEGGAFLVPFLGDDPFAFFNMWMNTSRASVFATHQNVPVVDRRSRHVLIRSPVRQVVLPEELAGLDFDSKQILVVPFDDLSYASKLSE